MKKKIFIFLITMVSLNCYAQISFEKGYYIDVSDKRVECLIKNIDWKNNPTEFEYKLSEDAGEMKATIESVKEFAINGMSKHKRYTVNIDRSNEGITQMSNVRDPIFQEEQLFLKVLAEGKANLYQYKESNLDRFFYESDNSEIEQLVYKSYHNGDNKIRKNNGFRQQLWSDLKCQSISIKDMQKIDYQKKDLVKYFATYNESYNSEPLKYVKKQKRDLFNLYIRPGLTMTSFSVQGGSNENFLDFW